MERYTFIRTCDEKNVVRVIFAQRIDIDDNYHFHCGAGGRRRWRKEGIGWEEEKGDVNLLDPL